LPRTARFNVQRLHTNLTQPLPHHLRRELRTVVRTDVIRNATHREQPRQPFQHIIRLELPSNIDRQALACELIHHRQPPEGSPILRPRCDEVIRPHVILPLRTQSNTTPIIQPQPSTLRLPLWNLQPLFTPDPFHALVIHTPALSSQHRRDPRCAVPAVHARQFNDPPRQRFFIITYQRKVPLRHPRLTQHPARPPFGNVERIHHVTHHLTLPLRAQKFGLAASRRIALSSSASASSRLRRLFSRSSSFSRF